MKIGDKDYKNIVFYGGQHTGKTAALEQEARKILDLKDSDDLDTNTPHYYEVLFDHPERTHWKNAAVVEQWEKQNYSENIEAVVTDEWDKNILDFTPENYLDCRGYRPGKLKRIFDELRRPDWGNPKPENRLYIINLYSGKGDCSNDNCKDVIRIPISQNENEKNVNRGCQTRHQFYETCFYSMKPGDYIIARFGENKIDRFGVISTGFKSNDTYLERKVDWYFTADSSEKRVVADWILPGEGFMTSYKLYATTRITPAAVVDLLMWNKTIEPIIPDTSTVIKISQINFGSFKNNVGRIRRHIRPEKMDGEMFELESGNIMLLPENAHILGIANDTRRGTEIRALQKYFYTLEKKAGENQNRELISGS